MDSDISKHRIQRAFRLLIGPWDDKAPSPLRSYRDTLSEPSSYQGNEPVNDTGNTRPKPIILQDTSNKNSNETAHKNTGTLSPPGANSNTLSQESFFTANSSVLAQQTGTDNNGEEELEDDPFRSQLETTSTTSTYTILPTTSSPTARTTTSNSNNSLKSGRTGNIVENKSPRAKLANSQGDQTSNSNDGVIPQITYNNDPPKKKKHSMKTLKNQALRTHNLHPTLSKSLLWRESGPVFVPRLPEHLTSPFSNIDDIDDDNTVIKHDILLCMRMINPANDILPTAYNARDTKYLKRQDGWRQLGTILTPVALECYDSKDLLWPHQKLVHRISLDSQMDPTLSLYMLSPLDYTFCLRHTPKGTKSHVTVVFRARSLTLCHEWYVALYRLLPDTARKPFPPECEVYIPSINLRVHLPLIKKRHSHNYHTNGNQNQQDDWNDSRYCITMDQVKNAVLDLLEKDSEWMVLHGNRLKRSDLSLCWTRKDRAEWIYWKQSVNQTHRSDKVICPQIIENTHRLELRPVQHTPHNVVLDEKTTLVEPIPCEGFLTKVTDFEGRMIKSGNWVPRRFYFSSFDGFLFAVPSHKAKLPDPRTYIDSLTLRNDGNALLAPTHLDRIKNSPYITLATPFAGNMQGISQEWQEQELDRRMHLVADSSGVINLAEVSYVQRSFGGYASADALLDSSTVQHDQDDFLQINGNKSYGSVSSSLMGSSTSPIMENGPPVLSSSSLSSSPAMQHRRPGAFGQGLSHRKNLRDRQRPCIDLVMNNGVILKLGAYTSEICDQWVTCLSDLVIYSKARMEADRDVHSGTGLAAEFSMMRNKQHNHQTSSEFGGVNCLCGRPDTRHDFVDTRIWSLCPFNHCQDITKSGVMYVRSKGLFSQKQFILTMDGRLHYYNIYKRDRDDGKPIRTGIHERKGTLDLANAYVYSGLASSLDGNLSKSRPNRPPRLFDNGMTTVDSDEDCFFTIWVPKRRRIFSPQRQRIMVYSKDDDHSHRRFHSAGTRWLFLTPSRQEKEEWVWSITLIQEELLREAVQKQSPPSPTTTTS
ncbi:unnamed protein product [Absidia cylindrospora]